MYKLIPSLPQTPNRNESLQDTISVRVVVGPEENHAVWYLPKKLLTKHSSFFAAALDGGFSEAESNSIALHNDYPEVFKFFVRWLYCGDDVGSTDSQPIYDIESWIFGDKVQCHGFQNFMMSRLLHYHYRHSIVPFTLRLAYEKSTAGSKLRQCVLDQFRWDCANEKGPHEVEECWVSLITEVADFGADFMRSYLGCREDKLRIPASHSTSYMVGATT